MLMKITDILKADCVCLAMQFPSLFKDSWRAQGYYEALKISIEKSNRRYGKGEWSNKLCRKEESVVIFTFLQCEKYSCVQ